MEFFFSANVYQRNIAFSVVHVQACLKSHPFIIVFLSCQARVADNSTNRTCASGWFVLPVGLCFRLVCASGWFVLPVGLCFRLVCASGWFVLPVGLCFRLV